MVTDWTAAGSAERGLALALAWKQVEGPLVRQEPELGGLLAKAPTHVESLRGLQGRLGRYLEEKAAEGYRSSGETS